MPGNQGINIGLLKQTTRLGLKNPALPVIPEATWQPVISMGDVGFLQSDPFEARGTASIFLGAAVGAYNTIELAAYAPGGCVVENIQFQASGSIPGSTGFQVARSPQSVVKNAPGAITAQIVDLGGVNARCQMYGQSLATPLYPFGNAFTPRWLFGLINTGQTPRIFVPPGNYFQLMWEQVNQGTAMTMVWRELDEPV